MPEARRIWSQAAASALLDLTSEKGDNGISHVWTVPFGFGVL